jgi:SM-20-related protein
MALATLCQGLATEGWAVADGFFEDESLLGLRAEALAQDGRDLRPAGVGRGRRLFPAEPGSEIHPTIRPGIRSDRIRWIDPAALRAAEAPAWGRLEELRVAFNRTLFLGLKRLEAHVALYPEGGHYERHVDRFHDDSHRIVSVVVYLNPTWDDAWGGHLCLYDAAATNGAPPRRTVSPTWGRLVCFLSDSIPHEVRPTTHPRLSLAGWFRDDGP